MAAEHALTVIAPGRSRSRLGLGEVWAYRELLFFLAWRDITIRYRQTVLGVAWIGLQPLLSLAVLSVIFGRLLKVPSGDAPYPAFLFAALLPWGFFSSSVTRCVTNLVGSAHLIGKVYFPRLIIPLGTVVAGVVDLGVSLVLLFGFLAYYQIHLTWRVSLLPLAILWLTATSLGVGLCLSALNVRYRDVGQALPVLLQAWLFATPVIYGVELIPVKYRGIAALNPMAAPVELFRSLLLGGEGTPFGAGALVASALLSVLILATGVAAFRSVERTIADVV
jgi:lipopolysaccharide transport system permease protein